LPDQIKEMERVKKSVAHNPPIKVGSPFPLPKVKNCKVNGKVILTHNPFLTQRPSWPIKSLGIRRIPPPEVGSWALPKFKS